MGSRRPARRLGGQPGQRDQTDLEINVVAHATEPHGGQCSEDAEGNGEDHSKRNGPALVLSSQHEKHHQQAERERKD